MMRHAGLATLILPMVLLAGCSTALPGAALQDIRYAAPATIEVATPPTALPVVQVSNHRAASGVPYKRIRGGKFELTRDVVFRTRQFGRVRITKGYHSDGSSSPIPDTHETRMAGFLHDALYSASGHLRFPDGLPAQWSKRQADDAYCDALAQSSAPRWHAETNCEGVRKLVHIRWAWSRLARKRMLRWTRWGVRPPG